MKAILGKKVGMTQIFAESGEVIPVTVIQAGPAVVTQIKTAETDGYDAVQIGFEDQKPQRVNRPMTGHFEKSGVAPKKYLMSWDRKSLLRISRKARSLTSPAFPREKELREISRDTDITEDR